MSVENTIWKETELFVSNAGSSLAQYLPRDIREAILDNIASAISTMNIYRPKIMKLKAPEKLDYSQIAYILLHTKKFVVINFKKYFAANDSSKGMKLAVYMESGEYEGIYVLNDDIIDNFITEYRENISSSGLKEVKQKLSQKAPKVCRCSNQDLIPVKNGVFNFKTKTLNAFSPDYIFTHKIPVDYNPNATNPIFTNPDGTTWDIEKWMRSLSDDPEVVNLLWEVVGAVIRPFVPWNKVAWLYSSSGNSGKGTLCELLRQLCGAGNYTSISAASFSEKFGLVDLITAISVINDENAVGFELGKTDILKAVTTGDVIPIEEKYKNRFNFQFRGLIVQCINEIPKMKDTSESYNRRQLLIPFDKCFNGIERKYIKEEYLKDNAVLEYVLYKILHMTHYEFSNPVACQELLETSRKINNPIHAFWTEIEREFVWDVLPMNFLYDIFKVWYKKDFNHETNVDLTEFKLFFKEKSQVDPAFMNGWKYVVQQHARNKAATKVIAGMAAPEPLIAKYNLTQWMNPTYTGSDINRMCTCPASCHKETYKGALVRVSSSSPALPVVDDDDDETEEETD